jgi:hypothetical protein
MKIQIGDEVRDMTQDEVANYKQVQRDSESVIAIIDAKAAALASARTKLAALGLTDDEVAALLGA